MKEQVKTLEDIYKKHRVDIYKYLYYQTTNCHVSEELCQEVFLKAFKGLSSYEGRSSIKTWIYSIAHNVYVSWYRKEIKIESVPLEQNIISSLVAIDGNPEAIIENKENTEQVTKILYKLKEEYRTVLILCELNELSYEEIANTLNWNLSKVKITIYRARIQFKTFFEKEGDLL
ncbi:RNA polymerase sigma factor [Clostridium tagluense]|uniref:RNA polymerase sigma factor n=1 Tax=Clostridium tagluense TaxID=360422 RepID=UPI001C0C522D|nr:RNA polymerase sigma factor [Clostridium tagluense]MBU3127230.1 RNA polymerase sigma factor [Clostridium tagluense]MBW9155475.1 RNA polymerase sigma factor [Clostridium tagluense]WLC66106.1 RNA polymerase sigma factor [Clostridium tagluense]